METQITAIAKELENVQLLLIAMERRPGEKEAERLILDANDSLVKTEGRMIQLEGLLSREPATVRQPKSLRVDQLKSDFLLIKNSLRAMEHRHNSRRERAREKEELLKKRFTKNSETRVNLEFDHELNVNEKLKFSSNAIDDLLVQGANVYESLQKQKNDLLNIRKRFLFFTKSLGISDTTIQLIDKRVREDKTIFLVGTVSCLIFMFCFYYWWQY